MKPVKIALVGAGQRGLQVYANYLLRNSKLGQLVSVAEPRDFQRLLAQQQHNLNQDNVFKDWKELVEKPKLADAVIIATQDRDHLEPTLEFMKKGYHVLLEKPMATSEEGVKEIVKTAQNKQIILGVCHVLRYSKFFKKIKDIIDDKRLGKVINVYHAEEIGFNHYAHSYVRGNWSNSNVSSPIILAKSCHDMDILLYILGQRCERLSSFGSLTHFNSKNRPEGAADNCLDCKYAQSECAYSAVKYYFGKLEQGNHGWPLHVITNDFTKLGVEKALRAGPYGRCVYSCDNNVLDHQIVNMQFTTGITANFSMTAFTEKTRRFIKINFTNGELEGDSFKIILSDFKTGEKTIFDFSKEESKGMSGHLGGDDGIMYDFLSAVNENNPALLSSGPEVSLQSHLMCFAAERSRINNTIETINI